MLRLEGVETTYGDAVMRYDLAVETGQCCAVIGPSGAGKSTLLHLVAGFLTPRAGRILVGGRDIAGLEPADRPLTMLFQDHNLFTHLDVFTNVALGVDARLRLDPAKRTRVMEALARLGLQGLEARLPHELSGGERQRVALARSLVRDRPLLLLDEPFAALGPALRADMLDLVDTLRRDRGLTVLIVTHQPEDARRIADVIAFVDEGKVAAFGPTAAVLDAPPPALGRYLGEWLPPAAPDRLSGVTPPLSPTT